MSGRMIMKDSPSYYAILPAAVRYDQQLNSSQKLFYAEITALSNKEGKCWASNSYFSKLYGVGNSTVSSWVTALKNKGYIYVDYEMDGKHIKKRYLTPIQISEGGIQISEGGYSENRQDNNTSNNTINSIYPFDEFWNDYDKKRERAKAENKWKSISEKDRGLIKKFIPIYKANQPDAEYRKYPYTFLNSKIWLDDWGAYKSKDEPQKLELYQI